MVGHEKLTIDLTRLFPHVRVIRIPKSGGAVDLDDTFREISHAWAVRSYFYGEPSLPKELGGLMGRMIAMEQGLSPYSFQIGFETLTVIRVGEGESKSETGGAGVGAGFPVSPNSRPAASNRVIVLPDDRVEADTSMTEHAAPSTALPLGSTRILSPTRLTRVDPTGPAHAVRLLNTVLAIVAINPDDRIPKTKPGQPEIKVEETKGAVKVEEGGEGEAGEAGEAAGAEGAEGQEGEVKVEEQPTEGDGAEGQEEGVAAEDEDEVDEDEDEVPYREEIGWREVLGFIVM